MPTGIRKRRWFVVVAFLGVAAIGIFIGLLVRLAAYTEEMDRLNRFPSGLSQIQPLNLTRLWIRVKIAGRLLHLHRLWRGSGMKPKGATTPC